MSTSLSSTTAAQGVKVVKISTDMFSDPVSSITNSASSPSCKLSHNAASKGRALISPKEWKLPAKLGEIWTTHKRKSRKSLPNPPPIEYSANSNFAHLEAADVDRTLIRKAAGR